MTVEDAAECRFDVPRDHPAFDGHFPGHPVLPGVVLLAEVLAVLERDTGTRSPGWILESAKFAGSVGPGARLVMTQRHAGGRVRFEIREAQRLVASGTLAPAAS